jgi:CBS domain-containing protein
LHGCHRQTSSASTFALVAAFRERFRPAVIFRNHETSAAGFFEPPREVVVKISNCMTRDVQIANPDQSIREAAQAMARLDAGVLPVGENDRLVGMITDRDIAVRAVAEGRGPETSIRDVMSTDVKYCFDDEEVDDVLQNMGDIQVRRLPVLNRDKRVVGIVSLGDIATNGEAAEAGQALSGISKPGGEHSQTMH